MICLITGGVKSGKSRYAVEMAKKYNCKRYFIATAEAFDDEMKEKIMRHKEEREGLFETIEEPVFLPNALTKVENNAVCVVDCLTVWTFNLLHYNKTEEIDNFLEILKKINFDLYIVTNEVGMGIVPADSLSRHYRDMLGSINQKVAKMADRVVLMVSGIPVQIKS